LGGFFWFFWFFSFFGFLVLFELWMNGVLDQTRCLGITGRGLGIRYD
jgi:hypothetical protein